MTNYSMDFERIYSSCRLQEMGRVKVDQAISILKSAITELMSNSGKKLDSSNTGTNNKVNPQVIAQRSVEVLDQLGIGRTKSDKPDHQITKSEIPIIPTDNDGKDLDKTSWINAVMDGLREFAQEITTRIKELLESLIP